ncbi:MAG: dihydroorotase [Bacillota bacterium]
MSVDLLIRGGVVVDSEKEYRADVAVKDGRIVGISDGLPVRADRVVDATGRFVMPGLVDSHVHLRYPGNPDREDFATGTKAAAAGGVTTIIEHPISVPAVSSVDILKRREEACAPGTYVDYAFLGAAGEDNLDDISGLAGAGVVGFKTFLHAAPPGREREFEGLTATTDGGLYEVMRAVAATGLPEIIHAESDSMVNYYIERMKKSGRNDILAHLDSRPIISELVSAAGALEMARDAGTRLTVAHISGGTVAEFLGDARSRGYDVTVETCPHYLFLSRDDVEELGPYAKINPPIRPIEEVERLWRALEEGIIDFVGSDHGPFLVEEKEPGWEDIWPCPAGAVGLETILPLFLDAVGAGRLALSDVVWLLSEGASRHFGLWPQKGCLAPGADADLVLVDLDVVDRIDREKMYTKAAATARLYDGRQVTGKPVATIVRGEVVMEDGHIVGSQGYGRMVQP